MYNLKRWIMAFTFWSAWIFWPTTLKILVAELWYIWTRLKEGLSDPAGTHLLLISSYSMTVALTWHILDSLLAGDKRCRMSQVSDRKNKSRRFRSEICRKERCCYGSAVYTHCFLFRWDTDKQVYHIRGAIKNWFVIHMVIQTSTLVFSQSAYCTSVVQKYWHKIKKKTKKQRWHFTKLPLSVIQSLNFLIIYTQPRQKVTYYIFKALIIVHIGIISIISCNYFSSRVTLNFQSSPNTLND